MGSNPTWGSSFFSFKRIESELSQVVPLCCLALFEKSDLIMYMNTYAADLGMGYYLVTCLMFASVCRMYVYMYIHADI